MIKKIHYCWFGSEKPSFVIENISKWQALNPDFTIVEWNDTHLKLIEDIPYAKEMIARKRWCFVSDVLRLYALLHEGGVYLDVDIELLGPISTKEDIFTKPVLGYIYDCALGTAFIYSPPYSKFIKLVLDWYQHANSNKEIVNNAVFTALLNNTFESFLLNGKRWENSELLIMEKEFFEQPSFSRTGISIHHCIGTWMSKSDDFNRVCVQNNIGRYYLKWIKRKIRIFIEQRTNYFWKYHKMAVKGSKQEIII